VQSAIADSHYAEEDHLGWLSRAWRILVGLLLIPVGAVMTATLFDPGLRSIGTASEAPVSSWHEFWRTPAFLYFTIGFVLNAGWFFTKLLQPGFLYLYVLGHELTHAVFVYLSLGWVSNIEVGLDGGHIVTNKSNLLIALSPYFIPFWTVVIFVVMAAIEWISPLPYHEKIAAALIGATWSFHLLWTLWIIPRDQPDLKENGTFFSLAVIYLANVLLISTMVCLAFKEITWRHFVYNWANNFMNLSDHLARGLESIR
jgi:hypothetical protein